MSFNREPDYYIEGIPVYVELMNPSQSNFPAYPMDPDWITCHETENHDEGADAYMHHVYLKNSAYGRQASWHYSVDDEKIVKHANHNQSCWHGGDGDGPGNTDSISIEHCENADGDFSKTVKNGQALVRHLMKEENIDIDHVVPHKKWSGKNCPNNLLPIWSKYINAVQNSKAAAPKVIPKKPIYSNNSIVDYLNKLGKDSSISARMKLAKEYDVKNYKGTAAQNLELLNKMRKGGPSRYTETTEYKGNSIVDYLNKKGISSSYKNRVKLAKENGIANYTGSAEQNLELLERLQKGKAPKSTYKGDSVVDYLHSIGEDASYSNRAKLAKKYGIKGYSGSANQNLTLLQKLRG